MRHERRPDFHQQRLELGVLRARISVLSRASSTCWWYAISCSMYARSKSAPFSPDRFLTLSAPPDFRLCAWHCPRGHAELGDKISRLLVDAGVVRHHLLAERLDLRIEADGLGQFAGIDVHLVGGDDDRGDLRVADCAGQTAPRREASARSR
jgi:hypothetical protein